MYKSFFLNFLLLGVIVLLFACGGKEHPALVLSLDDEQAVEEAKAKDREELCQRQYGDKLDDAKWNESFGESSLMKGEIFTKASSAVYYFSNTMEGREISYDDESGNFEIFVMDTYAEKNYFLETHIEGCSYWFDGISMFKSDTFEISPCLCKEEEGKYFYLNESEGGTQARSSSSKSIESSESQKTIESSESQSSSSEEPVIISPDSLADNAAYEFNDPENLGKDAFGLNNASKMLGNPEGDGDNIILDGESGLNIALSDVFKTNAFFIETRIYPERFSEIQNIIASEPPGSGKSGWMLRLDNGRLLFHVRNAERDYSKWTIFNAGEIALNKWTIVRVEKYASGRVVINVNGNEVVNDSYAGNIVNDEYNIGIGCSAVGQIDYSGRTFVGKMDYLRFGVISEDNP